MIIRYDYIWIDKLVKYLLSIINNILEILGYFFNVSNCSFASSGLAEYVSGWSKRQLTPNIQRIEFRVLSTPVLVIRYAFTEGVPKSLSTRDIC